MRLRRLTFRQWVGWIGLTIVFLLAAAVAVWRGDILKAGLDPQVPFQTYTPPPAPDYGAPAAWALRETRTSDAGAAAIRQPRQAARDVHPCEPAVHPSRPSALDQRNRP